MPPEQLQDHGRRRSGALVELEELDLEWPEAVTDAAVERDRALTLR